jgi:hypothetical protein
MVELLKWSSLSKTASNLRQKSFIQFGDKRSSLLYYNLYTSLKRFRALTRECEE